MQVPDWPGTGWIEVAAPDGFRIVRDGGITVLMIDRTAKRNALTWAMWESLPGTLADLEPDTRVLIVTGAGDTFSAGADVGELHSVYADRARARAYHRTNLVAEAALASFAHPTIAAVRGACVGGGCQLALACDLRIADRSARLGLTPAKLGVVYPAEPTARLARLVGPARAKYLLYTATLIPAEQALVYGLVDEVTDEPLTSRTIDLAGTIASRSAQSIAAAKAVIDAASVGADIEAAIAPWHHDSTDVVEGLAAFLERRPPTFGPA